MENPVTDHDQHLILDLTVELVQTVEVQVVDLEQAKTLCKLLTLWTWTG